MKKIMWFLLLIIILVTGCEEDSQAIDNTIWKTTDGLELVIKTDSCFLRRDGKQLGNVCKYESNASNSGVSKVTVCDRFGTNCDSYELEHKYSKTQNVIIISYGSFYRQ